MTAPPARSNACRHDAWCSAQSARLTNMVCRRPSCRSSSPMLEAEVVGACSWLSVVASALLAVMAGQSASVKYMATSSRSGDPEAPGRPAHKDISRQKPLRWWTKGFAEEPGFLGNELFRAGSASAAGAGVAIAAVLIILAEFLCFLVLLPRVWRIRLRRPCCHRGWRLRCCRRREQQVFSAVVPDPPEEVGTSKEVSADGGAEPDCVYWLGAPTLRETVAQQLRP